MATIIDFIAQTQQINTALIAPLPADASRQLPSRGQVAVTGTFSDQPFAAVLEPDGIGGHWLKVQPQLQVQAGINAGDTVTIELSQTKQWPEPTLPDDFKAALKNAPLNIQAMWQSITPMARWEWVRWVNATNNSQTRQRRIEVSIAKLQAGKRRPCCFNLSACTDPELSKNGKLIGLV